MSLCYSSLLAERQARPWILRFLATARARLLVVVAGPAERTIVHLHLKMMVVMSALAIPRFAFYQFAALSLDLLKKCGFVFWKVR